MVRKADHSKTPRNKIPGPLVGQTLQIRVLGEFQILKGSTQQHLPKSRKTRALLAYLVLTGRRHRRERLCDLLWDVPDDPRASLRWSLSRLRPFVDAPGHVRIVAGREHVLFDPESATVDLFEIRRELAGGADVLSTERLIDLAGEFRGELLEDFAISDLRDFESWLLTERQTAKRTRATLLHVLVNRLYAEGRNEAVPYARKLITADPYSVSAHAMLIRVLSATGHREEAERQHEISVREFNDAGEQELKRLTEALSVRRSTIDPDLVGQKPGTRLEQQIRFCTTSDGVRIAYASVGDGPPLMKTANWLNHLE